jgi:hypothetical protein
MAIAFPREVFLPHSFREKVERGAAPMVPFEAAMKARSRLTFRAFLFGSVLAASLASPASSRADEVTITADARTRFTAGVNLLKDPDGPRYEEAYREFKAAYASSPSYKILGNLGLCAMKLERDDEAIQAYEKYLSHEKDLDPGEVTQIKTDLQTLKAGVVYVTVASDPPGAQITDARTPIRGDRVTNIYGPLTQATRIGIRQGTHQLTARLEGYPDVVWDLDTGGAEVPLHTFTFKKIEQAATPAPALAPVTPELQTVGRRPIPAGVYIGAAATGALVVGAVVTGVVALGKHSDYQTENNGSDPSVAQSTKSAGETMNVVNDVCVGGAIVAAGVTVALYLLRPTVSEQAPPPATAQGLKLQFSPLVARTGGGMALGGRF